jgi:hypothetical protein
MDRESIACSVALDLPGSLRRTPGRSNDRGAQPLTGLGLFIVEQQRDQLCFI